jgi:thiosulfate/3-mercaptopyruvate sulfurtransferase
MNNAKYLVTPSELMEHEEGYLIVDTRKRTEYEEAHIKGAVPLPVDYWLKENDANNIARGESMISYEHFLSVMSGIGATNDSKIVVYDDNEGRGSTRFWFVAKHFGHESVYILDGGWKHYLQTNLPQESTDRKKMSFSYYVPNITKGYIIELSEIIELYDCFKIIDARSKEEWSGEDMHGNPRGGHLPSAIHLEWEQFCSKDTRKTFISSSQVREIMQNVGVTIDDSIVTYCQAGIRAANVAFALRLAGFAKVLMYDGSMHQWSRRSVLTLKKK